MYTTKEERIRRFGRRKGISYSNPVQAIAVCAILLIVPVALNSYANARSELSQAQTYNTVTGELRHE